MELDVGGSNPPGCTKIMKKKISRPPVELPAGFVDRKEKDLVIRDFLIKQIRETMTKYGFEEMLGKKYPNNMPIYKDILSDGELLAVLGYIKSTWPEKIKAIHNEINQSYASKKNS